MRIELVLTQSFESDWNGAHYYVYQFVDPQTLTILSFSSVNDEKLIIGNTYNCLLTIKRSKLAVSGVDTSK